MREMVMGEAILSSCWAASSPVRAGDLRLGRPRRGLAGTSPAMRIQDGTNFKSVLNPHRHQLVERALGILVLHQRRRAGIRQLQDCDLALDLCSHVEQVT